MAKCWLSLVSTHSMRIYFETDSDPLVTGTASDYSTMAAQVKEFLAGTLSELFISTDVDGSPAPYAVFMKGLRFSLSYGPVVMSLHPAGEICVAGSLAALDRWAEHCVFPTGCDSGHRHIDSRFDWVAAASVGLIIGIDDHDPADGQSRTRGCAN